MEPVNPWRRAFTGLVAHRGGAKEAPENTLYAFHRGLASGADALELDVQGTADGVPVVLHDETLLRVAGADERVDALTAEQVRVLDPCAHWPSAAGVATGLRPPPPGFTRDAFRIPTLEEVLATFPGVPTIVELKETAPVGAVAELLSKWHRTADVLVASFDETLTDAVQALLPEVRTGPGIAGVQLFGDGGTVRRDAFLVPASVQGEPLVTAGFVERAHEDGMGVLVWTIDDLEEARRLVALHVDMLVTDRPAALLPIVEAQVDPQRVREAYER